MSKNSVRIRLRIFCLRGAPTENSILEILFAMPLLPSLNPERGILSGFLENIFGLDVRSQNALKNFEFGKCLYSLG